MCDVCVKWILVRQDSSLLVSSDGLYKPLGEFPVVEPAVHYGNTDLDDFLSYWLYHLCQYKNAFLKHVKQKYTSAQTQNGQKSIIRKMFVFSMI